MDRWRLVVDYLDRPARVRYFEDVHALGTYQRMNARHAWRMEVPERLLGPAMSAEEAQQGYVISQQRDEWVIYERAM